MGEEPPRKLQRTDSGALSLSHGSWAQGSIRSTQQRRTSPQPVQTPPPRASNFSGDDAGLPVRMEVDEPPKDPTSIKFNIRRPTGQFNITANDAKGKPESLSHASEHLHESRASPGMEAELDRLTTGGPNVSSTPRNYSKRQKSPILGLPGDEDHKYFTRDYSDSDRHVQLVSEFTIRDDGGLDLEGQHIARIADKIQAVNYDAFDGDCLVCKIVNDLEPNLIGFFHKSKQYFLPLTILHGVLSTQTVLRLLQHLNEKEGRHRREQDLSRLASRIAPSLDTLGNVSEQFRRTFAALILTGKEELIFDFVDLGLNDVELLGIEFDGVTPTSKRSGLQIQPLFDGWPLSKIKRFESVRWELSPTFLAAQRQQQPVKEVGRSAEGDELHVTCFKRVLYALRSTEEVLPFQQVKRSDISGGFAEVRFFNLHKDQQDLPRFTRDKSNNQIAVKTLKNDNKGTGDQREAYENEVYIMERLASAIKSPHIARLLATIEVPKAVSGRERSDYHLILEAADRNVENLWTSKEWWSTRKVTDLHLARWVSRQCYGLTDALWRFHEFPKNENDSNGKTHGLHCDIKPDNLLHYQNWDPEAGHDPKKTVDDQLGVIQLSDFGLSSFHSTHSVENLHIAGDFLNYAAPETEFLLLHSPAADVWHLGCLFMDFATWLLEGPEGYVSFHESRSTTGLRGARSRFATFTTGDRDGKSSGGSTPRTIVEVNDAVLKQATYLCSHEKSSAFVRDLCHIAVNYMLVMRDTKQKQKHVEYSNETPAATDRLTSHGAARILEEMIDKNDDYFLPSQAVVIPFDSPKWKRPSWVLEYSVSQLRQISTKVRSLGLGPVEAGFTNPGKIVTEK